MPSRFLARHLLLTVVEGQNGEQQIPPFGRDDTVADGAQAAGGCLGQAGMDAPRPPSVGMTPWARKKVLPHDFR